MDNDSYSSPFVTAQRVVGLGRYALKFLEAEGIIFKQFSEIKKVNAINWVTEKTKEVREFIRGSGGENNGILALGATGKNPAAPTTNFSNAEINLGAVAEGGPGEEALAKASIKLLLQELEGEGNALLLDSQGKSDFLQLFSVNEKSRITKTKWVLDIGTMKLRWPVGATVSESKGVTHRIGDIPLIVLAIPVLSPGPGFVPYPNLVAKTNAAFAMNAETKSAFGATTEIEFLWLAIG